MSTATRGFASMDPIRRREVASSGGRAAHRLGKAHQWTRQEARAAVRKRRQQADQRAKTMAVDRAPRRRIGSVNRHGAATATSTVRDDDDIGDDERYMRRQHGTASR